MRRRSLIQSSHSPGSMRLRLLIVVLSALCCVGAQENLRSVRITVRDSDHKPIPGASITLTVNGSVSVLRTNAHGEANASDVPFSRFELNVNREGFQPVEQQVVPEAGVSTLELEVVLLPHIEKRETVQVQASSDEGGAAPQQLGRQQMKDAPSHPATIADALPLIAGVVRGAEGVVVAGADEKHTALLVNSVDMTDPATGQFG